MIQSEVIIEKELILLDSFCFGEGDKVIHFFKNENESKKTIGYASFSYNETTKTLVINEMEIIDKNKGYGKKAIKSLLSLFPGLKLIEGISLEKSVYFWNKFQTEFYETCEKCLLQNTDYCPLVYNRQVCDEYNENHFIITVNEL